MLQRLVLLRVTLGTKGPPINEKNEIIGLRRPWQPMDLQRYQPVLTGYHKGYSLRDLRLSRSLGLVHSVSELEGKTIPRELQDIQTCLARTGLPPAVGSSPELDNIPLFVH